MKAYPPYQDTKEGWLGTTPQHWKRKRLKYVARVCTDKLDSKPDSCHYIGLENIASRTGCLLLENTPEQVESNVICFRAGDVLFSKLRPYLAKAALPDFDGVGTTELLVLRPKSDIRPHFLLYRLLDNQFVAHVNSFTFGAKMPRVDANQVVNMQIAVPPAREQDAIVVFLEAKEAEIQEFIANQQRQIELLKEYKDALINRAVTGGLSIRASLKASGMPCIPKIPSHWAVMPNGRLFRERNDSGSAELPILVVSLNTGVTVEDFSGARSKRLIEDRTLYKRAIRGDIAYNMMRMWQGAVGEVPCDGLVSPAYVVAQPRSSTFSPYFAALFRTDAYKTEVNRNSRGIVTDRNRLYWDDFKQMKSPVPPLEEQHQIVNFINAESANLDQAVRSAEQQVSKMEEYRTALISAAVTGKIDVRNM